MFGYIHANTKELTEENKITYQAYYCGLCQQLKENCGKKGQMLLNYDIISEREYRLMYAMTHTMLEYCPEGHRKEAGRTMIHRIEWALKGE